MDSSFVKICAFIIERNGLLLVEKRLISKETDPGKIVFPGGHVEEKESLLDACKREIKEELGVECEDYKKICKLYCVSSGKKIEKQETHYFSCKLKNGEPKTLEAEKIFWIKPSQIGMLDLEVDKKALKKYLEKN